MSDYSYQPESSLNMNNGVYDPLPALRTFTGLDGEKIYETRLYQLFAQYDSDGGLTFDELMEVVMPILDMADDINDVIYLYDHIELGSVRADIASTVLDDGTNKFFWALHLIRENTIRRGRPLHVVRDFISKATSGDDCDEVEDWIVDELDLVHCDDCNEYEFSDLTQTIRGSSDDVCRVCIDDNYTYSEYYDCYIFRDDAREALDAEGNDCTIRYDDDDFNYNDDTDRYEHCQYVERIEIIGNYHSSKSKVRKQFDEWTTSNKRFIGVELEVEAKNCDSYDKATWLNDVINNGEIGSKVFFERDGSLNNGFEIITQPMSLPAQTNLWSFLKDSNNTKGLLSHNTSTCGLHVHISRAHMSSLQIAKIVTFVSNPENESLIRAVSRRYAEGYCKIVAKKIGQSARSHDRYEAINITPRETIEFRIFKGSLKHESVMAAIEFANAVVEFAKPANTSIKELTSEKFIEFINHKLADSTEYLRPYISNRLENA